MAVQCKQQLLLRCCNQSAPIICRAGTKHSPSNTHNNTYTGLVPWQCHFMRQTSQCCQTLLQPNAYSHMQRRHAPHQMHIYSQSAKQDTRLQHSRKTTTRGVVTTSTGGGVLSAGSPLVPAGATAQHPAQQLLRSESQIGMHCLGHRTSQPEEQVGIKSGARHA